MRARSGEKEKPRRSGTPVPLLVPCFLARTRPLLYPRRSMRRSTSEPAARVERVGFSLPQAAHGRLYRRPHGGRRPAATAILHGLARRTAPQTQPPRSGSRASRWVAQESPAEAETPAGPSVVLGYQRLALIGPPISFNPQDQSRKPILHKKGPSAKPGRGHKPEDLAISTKAPGQARPPATASKRPCSG